MFLLQERRKVQYALRLADIDPMILNRRQPPLLRQRLRFPQLRITLQRLDRILSPPLVPRAQVDEQRPIIESRGRILQGEVADDGQTDAFIRARHGGDAGELWHGVVGARTRCHVNGDIPKTAIHDGGRMITLTRGAKEYVLVTLTLDVGSQKKANRSIFPSCTHSLTFVPKILVFYFDKDIHRPLGPLGKSFLKVN